MSGSQPASAWQCWRGSRLVGPGRPAVETGHGARPSNPLPVPSTLDWNLWLGPIRERPYSPAYAPVSWRGWWDFGTGAMGDIGCPHHRSPRLGTPAGTAQLRRGPHDNRRVVPRGRQTQPPRPIPLPRSSIYEFPAHDGLPPRANDLVRRRLDVTATSGLAPRVSGLPANGVLYIGSKGKLFHGSHGGMPQLLPRPPSTKMPSRSRRRSNDLPVTTKNGWEPAKGGSAPRSPTSTTQASSPRSCCWASSRCKATRTPARVGQRKPQDQKRSRTRSSGAHRISERMDAVKPPWVRLLYLTSTRVKHARAMDARYRPASTRSRSPRLRQSGLVWVACNSWSNRFTVVGPHRGLNSAPVVASRCQPWFFVFGLPVALPTSHIPGRMRAYLTRFFVPLQFFCAIRARVRGPTGETWK